MAKVDLVVLIQLKIALIIDLIVALGMLVELKITYFHHQLILLKINRQIIQETREVLLQVNLW